MTMIKRALVLALAVTTSAGAWSAGEIELRNTVEKVEIFVNEDGEQERRLVPATSVVPGDEIRYTIFFENVAADVTVDAGSVVITNPMPESTAYVGGSAFGAGTSIEFSVDGGENWGDPDSLVIVEDAGERLAEPEDYTHVRWTLEPALEPGDAGSVFFRVKLL
jgi:uncharacterized repeat protein (TIGR01451 family)